MADAGTAQDPACRAPGPRGAVAGCRRAGRRLRHAGGRGARRTAAADRLRRPGARRCSASTCTRTRRAPTGRAGRCARQQIAYALDDVRHLLPLRAALDERLRTARPPRLVRGGDGRRSTARDRLPSTRTEAWMRLRGLTELDPDRRGSRSRSRPGASERAMSADRPRGWILPRRRAARHRAARAAHRRRSWRSVRGAARGHPRQQRRAAAALIVAGRGCPARCRPCRSAAGPIRSGSSRCSGSQT